MKYISIVAFYKREEENFFLWFQPREVEMEGEVKLLNEFPGGKIELNENPHQAAIREVREEVGVNLTGEKLKLFKIYQLSKEFHLFVYNINNLEASLDSSGWVNIDNCSPEEFSTFPMNYQMIEELNLNKSFLD